MQGTNHWQPIPHLVYSKWTFQATALQSLVPWDHFVPMFCGSKWWWELVFGKGGERVHQEPNQECWFSPSACHPSCKTCHGPSDWECSTCHPHATLDGGKCRTGCKEEQYLNLVGYCVGESGQLLGHELSLNCCFTLPAKLLGSCSELQEKELSWNLWSKGAVDGALKKSWRSKSCCVHFWEVIGFLDGGCAVWVLTACT